MEMKSIIFASLSLFFAAHSATSQELIALHHQSSASFYSTLDSAYAAAANGDTLYLPGGLFAGFTMNKSLALIGVGYNPDSTLATGPTILTSLTLDGGADSSSITGIQISGEFKVYNDTVVNVLLFRCYLSKRILLNGSTITDWVIAENWIEQIYVINGTHFTNNIISNNVIRNGVSNSNSSLIQFTNNILLGSSFNGSNSIVKNNIFSNTNNTNYTSSSQYNNNLNSGVNGSTGSNVGFNNYLVNLPLDSVFVNYTSSSSLFGNDFHVADSTYVGTDGNPVGIYGGLFPWKEGGLPFTPHVRVKNIANASDTEGKLHINITAKAQSN